MPKTKSPGKSLFLLMVDLLIPENLASVCLLATISVSAALNAQMIAVENPLLIDYRKQISLVRDADNAIQIQVYVDGTVRVHQPYFMRRAGDYSFQLDQQELDQLMAQMTRLGVDRFDAAATSTELKTASRQALDRSMQEGSLRIIQTDADVTRMRIATSQHVDKMHGFVFRGVKSQARSFPQIKALSDLAQALERLDELGKDSRLRLQVVDQ